MGIKDWFRKEPIPTIKVLSYKKEDYVYYAIVELDGVQRKVTLFMGWGVFDDCEEMSYRLHEAILAEIRAVSFHRTRQRFNARRNTIFKELEENL